MPQDLDAVSSKLTIIPDVFDSQKQVAKRILDRVFILTGTAAPFHDRCAALIWLCNHAEG